MTAAPVRGSPSPLLATAGNALGQVSRPAVLLISGLGYGAVVVGDLAATLGIVVLATVAIYPAFGQAVLRHRAGFVVTHGLLRRVGAVLAICTALLAVVLAADAWTVGFVAGVMPRSQWTWWVPLLAPLIVAEQYALGLASAAGLLDRFSATTLVSRLTLIVAAAGIAAWQAPPVWLLAILALASVAPVLQVLRAVGRPAPGPAPTGLRRDAWTAAPNAWAWFLMAQASILVVQAAMGSRAAGIFAVAYLLLNVPAMALQGIAMTWSARATKEGPGSEWQRTRRSVPFLVLGHAAAVGLIVLAGTFGWQSLFGPSLQPAFALLARMALGAPGFALAYLFMPQWVARGWFLQLSLVYLALAAGFLIAVAWAASSNDLDLVGWCTAGLGITLAVANLAAARRWDRTAGVAA